LSLSQIIDAIRYAQSLLRNHAHAAGDGSRGINTDVIIKSRKRIGPPFEVQSRQMNLRLNAQFWGGHKVGDPVGLPFIVERFPDIAHRPAFGTQGRLIYIDGLDVIQLDVGTAWLAIAEEGSIDWENILNKPSTFPATPHVLLDGSVHSDSYATSVLRGMLAVGQNVGGIIFWKGLALGSTGKIPISDGTDLVYRLLVDADLPATLTGHTLASPTLNGTITIGADANFSENQALNFKVENVASLPAAGNKGRLVCLIATGVVYYDNGSGWVQG